MFVPLNNYSKLTNAAIDTKGRPFYDVDYV